MAARTTLTSMLPKDWDGSQTTALFGIIYYMDLAGGALMQFILASAFAAGVKQGGYWIGLPLFCASLLWSVVALLCLLADDPLKSVEEGTQTAIE